MGVQLNRIKEVLEEKNLTQKWLSDQMGVSVVTANAWCSNKSQPSLKRIFEISNLVNVPPSKLLTR